MTKIMLLITIFALFISCAQWKESSSTLDTENTDSIKNNNEDLEQEPDNLESVTKKLSQIEAKLKAKGDHALVFFASDLYLKASRSAIEGDHNVAVVLLRYLVQLYPEDQFLKMKLVTSLIRLGDLDEARKILEGLYQKKVKNNRDDRKNEVVGLVLAGVYSALLQKQEAIKIYQEVIDNYPKSEEACLYLAMLYQQEEQQQKAMQILNRCELKTKDKGIFSYQKGRMAQSSGRLDEAEQLYRKALQKNPEHFLAALALGELLEKREKYQSAYAVYKDFLNHDPSQIEILNKMVRVLFILEKFQEVIPYLEILSKIDPDDLNLKVKLGVIYSDTERYDEAKKIFHEILVQVPNSDKVNFYLASVYAETEKYGEAIRHYQQVGPDSSFYQDATIQEAQIWALLAEANSKYEANFLNFVENREKELPHALLTLRVMQASFHERKNDIEKAIDRMASVKNEEGFDENHQYYLATLLEKNKQYQQSREAIWAIVKKNPKNAEALNFLGFSLLEEGSQLQEAYGYIRRAFALKPKDPFIRDSLGWYYFKVGQHQKALKELLYAREQIGDDHIISQHLAAVYERLGKIDLAEKYYQEALNNSKQESDKNEIQQQLQTLRKPASLSTENP